MSINLFIINNDIAELKKALEKEDPKQFSVFHNSYHSAYESKNFEAMLCIFEFLSKFNESEYMLSLMEGVSYASLLNKPGSEHVDFSNNVINHFVNTLDTVIKNPSEKNRGVSSLLNNIFYFHKSFKNKDLILEPETLKELLSYINKVNHFDNTLFTAFSLAHNKDLYANEDNNQDIEKFILYEMPNKKVFSSNIYKQLLLDGHNEELLNYIKNQKPLENLNFTQVESILLLGASGHFLSFKEDFSFKNKLFDVVIEDKLIDMLYSFNYSEILNPVYTPKPFVIAEQYFDDDSLAIKINNKTLFKSKLRYDVKNNNVQLGQFWSVKNQESRYIMIKEQQELNTIFKSCLEQRLLEKEFEPKQQKIARRL